MGNSHLWRRLGSGVWYATHACHLLPVSCTQQLVNQCQSRIGQHRSTKHGHHQVWDQLSHPRSDANAITSNPLSSNSLSLLDNSNPGANLVHAPEAPHTSHRGRSCCKPPMDLLLPSVIGLRTCILFWIFHGETLPTLDNDSTMCLVWYLFDSYSIDCHKHRYDGDHHHLTIPELHHALNFRHW